MPEEEKLFYTIGEVAQNLNIKPYVLRYWETEFSKLNPQKSVTGQRAYRIKDIRMASTIYRLLYKEKYTIAGARKKLEELDDLGALDPADFSANISTHSQKEEELASNMPHEIQSDGKNIPEKRDVPVERKEEIKGLIADTKTILKKHGIEY